MVNYRLSLLVTIAVAMLACGSAQSASANNNQKLILGPKDSYCWFPAVLSDNTDVTIDEFQGTAAELGFNSNRSVSATHLDGTALKKDNQVKEVILKEAAGILYVKDGSTLHDAFEICTG